MDKLKDCIMNVNMNNTFDICRNEFNRCWEQYPYKDYFYIYDDLLHYDKYGWLKTLMEDKQVEISNFKVWFDNLDPEFSFFNEHKYKNKNIDIIYADLMTSEDTFFN